MEMMMMMMELAVFLVIFLLELSCALDIPCIVTRDGGLTRYSVPEFNATGCHYQWFVNNTVVADQVSKPDELVKMNTNNTLEIYGCQKDVSYKLDCLSGMQRVANCSTICADYRKETSPEHGWIAAVVVIAVVLLLVLVLGILCYRFRKQICRCFFTGKKTQDNPAVEVQVNLLP